MGLLSRLFSRDKSGRLSPHLPRHLVPPPGEALKGSVATKDMYDVLAFTNDYDLKASLFITRCFDNALYCDAREWHPTSAREAALRVFGPEFGTDIIREMQSLAEESVRLGYRAATSLDPDVVFGLEADNSWKQELAFLVAKARASLRPG